MTGRSSHPPRMHRPEDHKSRRAGWIRAMVLGANDGLLSTGALLLGVAGAGATSSALLVAGVAALAAGALSMGVGEYVSVSSQLDVMRADQHMEATELKRHPEAETRELTSIYQERGLSHDLAEQVAEALMAHDPLGAHMRDELGHTEEQRARPTQAAASSMGSFAVGATVPLLVAVLTSGGVQVPAIAAATIVGMVALGCVAASLGGAPLWRGALRVGIGGSAALAATFVIGTLFDSVS
ncbi:MAG TPA: VIT family protein [Microthrixaceae bacterium]|nr:VIT family protein [Microthrixaceae bacterium]HNB96108.1 VIT family protein [Microthrixaceae bacterium]HNH37713.1 VIT family protein [Microthrixaceae bacterium]HNH95288.1 VIT family protein [Microthrixaceae bacterium]